ncbi:hypothetical protein JHK87_013152 [Glycine soja]|nr:hypothetical protein JHK87_013152 [Glycine soja]
MEQTTNEILRSCSSHKSDKRAQHCNSYTLTLTRPSAIETDKERNAYQKATIAEELVQEEMRNE